MPNQVYFWYLSWQSSYGRLGVGASAPGKVVERSKSMDSCKLCQGQGQILVKIPGIFLPLVTEPGSSVIPEIKTGGYPMDCVCIRHQPAGKDFGGKFWEHSYHDVTAVLLRVASAQQWFNALASCDDGYMSGHSDQFAAAHGLSTEFAPY